MQKPMTKPDTTILPLSCKRLGCPNQVPQILGHRKREYCSNACKQQDYRHRKKLEKQTIDQKTQQRIDELENKVHVLQSTLKFETQLRTDVKVRHFKAWLRKHPKPQDIDFFRRFLADARLPQHGSRALYEAKLRSSGYSLEDLQFFHDSWLTMLIDQENQL